MVMMGTRHEDSNLPTSCASTPPTQDGAALTTTMASAPLRTWARLGQTWAKLGQNLGKTWASWADLGKTWTKLGQELGHFDKVAWLRRRSHRLGRTDDRCWRCSCLSRGRACWRKYGWPCGLHILLRHPWSAFSTFTALRKLHTYFFLASVLNWVLTKVDSTGDLLRKNTFCSEKALPANFRVTSC